MEEKDLVKRKTFDEQINEITRILENEHRKTSASYDFEKSLIHTEDYFITRIDTLKAYFKKGKL